MAAFLFYLRITATAPQGSWLAEAAARPTPSLPTRDRHRQLEGGPLFRLLHAPRAGDAENGAVSRAEALMLAEKAESGEAGGMNAHTSKPGSCGAPVLCVGHPPLFENQNESPACVASLCHSAMLTAKKGQKGWAIRHWPLTRIR